ncbi:MAG: KH domain-containing protein [Candidatus Pacebacteria bacterium]|nr:KH domain-containing protein [Candidatus Paceibacterota bacterium]
MKNLLEYLIIHLVTHPEEVRVEQENDDYRTIFRIFAHPDDIGRIIGYRGRTIKAIRRVGRILAAKQNLRFRIEVEG